MTTTTTWPEARPTGGRLGLVLLDARTEARASLRTPEFLALAITVPVLLYAMFGLPNATETLAGGSTVGVAMMVSLAMYGVVTLAITVFGEEVAKERGRGWVRTLYATGFPPAVHLAGKAGAALVHAALVVTAVGALAAFAGGVELSAGRWLGFGVLLVSGVLVFSSLGFAIAYLARPRTATTLINVVFLPLSFASGFFVPLSQLPDWVAAVAHYLPTYHFAQLAYRTVMPEASVEAFTGSATSELWVHVLWVLGSAAALAALALVGARREAVTRRG
ncbi:MAG TPA: ABC transporter permease [Nocardioidaceae bacterium]|nr:ABC transporter permease [Nocardioidaceae bacterium]